MNEKIKELAIKAAIQHYPTFDSVALYGEYSKRSYDKEIENMMLAFAELIVKECLKVVEDTIDDGDASCCTNMADFITRNIKNHFES